MSELVTSARKWAEICESQGRGMLAGLFTDLADAVDGSALESADWTIEELSRRNRDLVAQRNTTQSALAVVLRATSSTRIYAENTGKGVGDQAPALKFAGDEYGEILRDSDGAPVAPDVLAAIEAALPKETR